MCPSACGTGIELRASSGLSSASQERKLLEMARGFQVLELEPRAILSLGFNKALHTVQGRGLRCHTCARGLAGAADWCDAGKGRFRALTCRVRQAMGTGVPALVV